MARQTNDRELAPVLDAAKQWIDRCLIGDQSLFTNDVVWTEPYAAELQRHFVDNPDYSKGSFAGKLAIQLAPASPHAKQLMAEIYWAIQLFPVTPKSKKKREMFLEVWSICGHPLPPNQPMLQDAALNGIGSAGTAYLTAVWREIVFLIRLLLKLKSLPKDERRALFSSNQKLSPWLDALVEKGSRQFPHILRYFAFPDEIERISSAPDKKKILTGFGVSYDNRWFSIEVDQHLYALRQKQEALHPGEILDFYDPPLVGTWKTEEKQGASPNDDTEAETSDDDSSLEEPAQSPFAISEIRPINRIFYGPPGTGKTRQLCELFARYTDEGAGQDRKTWLFGLIQDCRWRDVITAALAEKGPLNAPAIRDHELVQAKLAASQASTSQIIQNCLKYHTPANLETVQTNRRGEPSIFIKNKDSIWSLLPGWKQEEERLTQFVNTYLGGPGNRSATKRYRTVTFHPSYSYEDFVRGIRPVASDEMGGSEFRLVDGVFKQICAEARANPAKHYALFIDEINRGNIAKIFGELITLIEPDKRITLAADGSVTKGMTVQLPGGNTGEVAEPPFGVPANLDLYGTMNTADRSIALLDIALRRRFEFVEMPPRYDATVFPSRIAEVDRAKVLTRINDRLEYLLDRDHRIGHAYLMKALSLSDLRVAFANQIIPLLQEYFFDDLGKVALVLAGPDGRSSFVEKNELRHSELFPGDTSRNTTTSRNRFLVTDPNLWSAEDFQGIYATASAEPAAE